MTKDDGAPGCTAAPSPPTSPSSFSGSSPPSAVASFVSPFRLRRRLRFFFASPASSAPSLDSGLTGESLMSTSVAEGGVPSGIGTELGAKTVFSRGVACDSNRAVSVASSVPSSGAIERRFHQRASYGPACQALSADPPLTPAVASCPSGGAFLLNHSNDAMTDTSAKNSPEFEWAHE
jgi:hypothetical protein